MITLNKNYSRNVEILKENLKRGMTFQQVNNVIDSQEKQFKNANLYNQDEKDYINVMRAVIVNNFTHINIIN